MYSDEELKLIKRANRQIKAIENNYGKESWAVKKLKSRLDGQKNMLKSGMISTRKNISDLEKKATLKAVNQFLESKTSKVTGIKEIEKRIKSNIKEYTSKRNKKGEVIETTSKQDIENLYRLFEDKDFQDLSKYIPPSDIQIFAEEIVRKKRKGTSELKAKNYFIKQINKYAEGSNDMEINQTLNKLFDKIYNE